MRYLAPVLNLGPGSVVSLVGAGGKTSLLFALAREVGEAWGWDKTLVTTTTRMFYPALEDFPPVEPTLLPAANEALIVTPAPAARRFPAPMRIQVQMVRSLAEALTVVTRRPEAGGPNPGAHDLLVLARGTEPASGPGGRDKITGLPPEWVDAIATARSDLVVLVEADGSARRPLKAPASHEPVIPSRTTVVLSVAGVDALGQPLGPEVAHRPERVSRLTGIPFGEAITPEGTATVLWHASGCSRRRPPAAELVPVMNKARGAGDPAVLPQARAAAAALHRLGAGPVVLASCADWPVVAEVSRPVPAPPVAAVILAAGTSSRLGRPKQLLPWDGRTLIERVVEEALRSSVASVYVVLGHGAGPIESRLAPWREQAGGRLTVVHNPDYAEGQSTSVRAGLTALVPDIQAAIFAPVDQPLIGSSHFDALVDRFAGLMDFAKRPDIARRPDFPRRMDAEPLPEGVAVHRHCRSKVIVLSQGRTRRGLPALFSRPLFPELLQVEGDEGGRSVIQHHPEALCAVPVADGVLEDIDTWEDYLRLRQRPGLFR